MAESAFNKKIMACLSPKQIVVDMLQVDGTYAPEKIFVPCGKCDACLLARQSEWRVRLNEEFASCQSAFFFTLTYAPENLPVLSTIDFDITEKDSEDLELLPYPDETDPFRKYRSRFYHPQTNTSLRVLNSLARDRFPRRLSEISSLDEDVRGVVSKRDIQLFLKRLRKSLEPCKIRYFISSEYGPETHRPHYHGIIFNYPVNHADCKEKQIVNFEKVLQRAWQNGFVRADLCNGPRLNYCAKYCVKPSDAVHASLPAPFILCSRRPAIGSAYLERVDLIERHLRQYTADYVTKSFKDGKPITIKLPRYYVRKIFDEGGRSIVTLLHRLKALYGRDFDVSDLADLDPSDVARLAREKQYEQRHNRDLIEHSLKKQRNNVENARKAVRKAHKGGGSSKRTL